RHQVPGAGAPRDPATSEPGLGCSETPGAPPSCVATFSGRRPTDGSAAASVRAVQPGVKQLRKLSVAQDVANQVGNDGPLTGAGAVIQVIEGAPPIRPARQGARVANDEQSASPARQRGAQGVGTSAEADGPMRVAPCQAEANN